MLQSIVHGALTSQGFFSKDFEGFGWDIDDMDFFFNYYYELNQDFCEYLLAIPGSLLGL